MEAVTPEQLSKLNLEHIAESGDDIRKGDTFTCSLQLSDCIAIIASLRAQGVGIYWEGSE